MLLISVSTVWYRPSVLKTASASALKESELRNKSELLSLPLPVISLETLPSVSKTV
jgi:hypothetical protein